MGPGRHIRLVVTCPLCDATVGVAAPWSVTRTEAATLINAAFDEHLLDHVEQMAGVAYGTQP